MKKIDVFSSMGISLLAIVTIVLIFQIWENTMPQQGTAQVSSTTAATSAAAIQTTAPTAPVSTTQNTTAASESVVTTSAPQTSEAQPVSKMPQTTQEIIDKYTFLVDKFKKEKPAYNKKEYQSLPEEYRNFGNSVNFILNIASNYMVAEEDAEELIRPAGSEDILYDMPIHGAEKGCALTNYDAVEWAKCEDLGDGTYKISFSLKEEKNAEPTPADTLVPVSAHGAVMQPMAFSELQIEVNNIADGIPGATVNGFDLYYRDGVFGCVYNPQTDEVLSITHNAVIDISADIVILASKIDGSARLLNDMLIYNITW